MYVPGMYACVHVSSSIKLRVPGHGRYRLCAICRFYKHDKIYYILAIMTGVTFISNTILLHFGNNDRRYIYFQYNLHLSCHSKNSKCEIIGKVNCPISERFLIWLLLLLLLFSTRSFGTYFLKAAASSFVHIFLKSIDIKQEIFKLEAGHKSNTHH